MEEKIQEIVFKIKSFRSLPGPIRYPESLKQEIIALYYQSKHPTRLVEQLGLSYGSVTAWRRIENSTPTLTKAVGIFKTIAVSPQPPAQMRLVFTNGIFVENLSEEFLLKVLKNAFSAR